MKRKIHPATWSTQALFAILLHATLLAQGPGTPQTPPDAKQPAGSGKVKTKEGAAKSGTGGLPKETNKNAPTEAPDKKDNASPVDKKEASEATATPGKPLRGNFKKEPEKAEESLEGKTKAPTGAPILKTAAVVKQVQPFCTDFNDGRVSGFDGQNAGVRVVKPGEIIPTPEGSNTAPPAASGVPSDQYLVGTDNSGASRIYAPLAYAGDWTPLSGKCLCMWLRVINDGWAGEEKVWLPNFSLYYSSNGIPNPTMHRAVFHAKTQFAIKEGQKWVRICAPIGPSVNGRLPSNDDGDWMMADNGTAADWDNLLKNVTGIFFGIDLAGSGAQSEVLAIDDICIKDCGWSKGENGITTLFGDTGGTPRTVPGDIKIIDSTGVGTITLPSPSSCCDGPNLVTNGSLDPKAPILSDYQPGKGIIHPGEYGILTATTSERECPAWKIPAACAKTSITGNFLAVNGKTNQPPGTASVIWSQTVSITGEKPEEYHLCFRYLPFEQCCFNVSPKLSFQVSTPGGAVTISNFEDKSVGCGHVISASFKAGAGPLTVKILLAEDGLGDGNDLAADNISLVKAEPVAAALTSFQLNVTPAGGSNFTLKATAPLALQTSGLQWQWQAVRVDASEVEDTSTLITVPGQPMSTTFTGLTFTSPNYYKLRLKVWGPCNALTAKKQIWHEAPGERRAPSEAVNDPNPGPVVETGKK